MRLFDINGKQVATHQQWPLEGKGILLATSSEVEHARLFTSEGKAIIPSQELSYSLLVLPMTRKGKECVHTGIVYPTYVANTFKR